jgi:hypothetical protein
MGKKRKIVKGGAKSQRLVGAESGMVFFVA